VFSTAIIGRDQEHKRDIFHPHPSICSTTATAPPCLNRSGGDAHPNTINERVHHPTTDMPPFALTPVRIFISSVQKEFAGERAALRDYLRGDALMRRFFEDVPAAAPTTCTSTRESLIVRYRTPLKTEDVRYVR